MTDEPLELVHGSGNVYRDMGDNESDVRQAKALLAAEIIKILDEEGLSTSEAQDKTGIDHSEFIRICGANLKPFTIDRLILILSRLNYNVEISVTTHPKQEFPSKNQIKA